MTESPRSEQLLISLKLKRTEKVYPAGSRVLVEFGRIASELDRNSWRMRITLPDGEICLTRRCSFVYVVPEIDELDDDGIAQSVLGESVEPDGFDCDGSPSWLMALGLI